MGSTGLAHQPLLAVRAAAGVMWCTIAATSTALIAVLMKNCQQYCLLCSHVRKGCWLWHHVPGCECHSCGACWQGGEGAPSHVCNSDWTLFAAFDSVAVINGSALAGTYYPEAQVMGLVQLLRRLDARVTPTWFAKTVRVQHCKNISGPPPDPIITPNGKVVHVRYDCWSLNLHEYMYSITELEMEVLNVPSSINAALRVLPALDQELDQLHQVAALHSFPNLQKLVLSVGSGTLVPQLAALT